MTSHFWNKLNKDQREMKILAMLMEWKKMLKCAHYPLNLEGQCSSHQNINDRLHKPEKKSLTLTWKQQTPVARAILTKHSTAGGTTPDFRTQCWGLITALILAQTYNSMESNRKPESNLHIYNQIVFDKRPKNIHREQAVSPVQGTGKPDIHVQQTKA